MHVNHWIEIDKEYKWYIDQKAQVIRKQGKTLTLSAHTRSVSLTGGP